MILKATTIISLFLFFTANAICSHAESPQVHHKVNIQIKPFIAIYLDAENDVIGLFHITGSRNKIDETQIQVYKNGRMQSVTRSIFLRYIMLQESDYINWNVTGYYPIAPTAVVSNQTISSGPTKKEIIITVSEGDEGLEYSIE